MLGPPGTLARLPGENHSMDLKDEQHFLGREAEIGILGSKLIKSYKFKENVYFLLKLNSISLAFRW